MGKTFEKQAKTIEDQGKKQISVIKKIGKEITEPRELAKNDVNIDRNGIPSKKQKETFNELAKERARGLSNIKDKIVLNNLVYGYSTAKNRQKRFWKLSNVNEII